jgi:biotin synthase
VSSLITVDEARYYGRLTDHTEIDALVDRAWEVRVENFGNSTDLCALVNAKSGGCAEV